MSRKAKIEGAIEPGKGVSFTPRRSLDEAEWIVEFNALLGSSQLSRTQLIIDLLKKGLAAYHTEQEGGLSLTAKERQLILFMRANGLSDADRPSREQQDEAGKPVEHLETINQPVHVAENEKVMNQLKQQLKGIQM
ncbi:MAG: hypothetical protein ABF497_10915 [Sporolactobacillus sp.]